ncbi:MAG: hypothetical protein KIT69_00335 [Propionibacteriaceae bacterium]|nr:hypothetical protein [Propionibacteriaceae bacterium]
MILGRPSVDDLVRLTEGGRDSVTIYQSILPPEPYLGRRRLKGALDDAITTAVNRLVGRGAGHDIHWAIGRQFRKLLKGARYDGQSVALFLTTESATGFVLPDRVEPAVRVGDYFDLGPLLRSATMAHHVYGVTLNLYGWALWEATGTEPAWALAGNDPGLTDPGGSRRLLSTAARRRLALWASYFRSHRSLVLKSLQQVRERLAEFDPQGSALVVLFPDDAFAGWRSDALELARLGRPVEVVHGDAETLTPGRIGRELRRHGRRLVRQELSQRIALLRAEHADGYPSTDLAEIAVAAAAGRVRTFVYDSTASCHGRLDRRTGRFEADQWGYDALARIAIDVLAAGGEAYAVTPDELLAGTMDTPALAEIAYPTLR